MDFKDNVSSDQPRGKQFDTKENQKMLQCPYN